MRLIIDPALDGATHMARDQALLTGVGAGHSPPTLRLYRWDPPTISLGYFQRFADFERLAPLAGGLAVVRRTTGGGAILHDQELTYAIVLPGNDPRCHPQPSRLYELAHDAVIDTLKLLGIPARRCGVSDDSAAHRGPFFCFERRHCLDVVVGNAKIAGSAQRRTPAATLQHGSIILGNRFDQHPVATVRDHVDVDAAALLEPLTAAFERHLGEPLLRGEWSAAEQAGAVEWSAHYRGDAWTRKY